MIIDDKTAAQLKAVLKCADADLQGIKQRCEQWILTDDTDIETAEWTRQRIAELFKSLFGEDLTK